MVEYPSTIFEKQITLNKRPFLVPTVNDTFTVCKSEDEALGLLNELLKEEEGEVLLSSILTLNKFKTRCTRYEPVFINEKRYNFFGLRTKEKGHFYLYETE